MSKRLIFTVTSGRSGTAYLTHLLTGLPGIRATHEAMPGFHGLATIARHDPLQAMRFLQDVKLPYLYAFPEQTYVETSHYFAKGFVEPLLALGVVPDLILLKRHPRKIASSWFLVGGTLDTYRNGQFYKNMLGPNEPNFLPVRQLDTWNDYQFCYWYALETHARIRHYDRLIKEHGGKTFEIDLAELTADDGYWRLLAWLNVAPEQIEMRVNNLALRRNIVNDMAEKKRLRGRADAFALLDLDVLEAQVRYDCGLSEAQLEKIMHPAQKSVGELQ